MLCVTASGLFMSTSLSLSTSISTRTMESRSTQYGSVVLSANFKSLEKERDEERVWPVAVCSFIACLASLLCGLMLSFSSPTLAELAEEPNPNRRILANQTAGSLFAVSGKHC